MSENHFDDDPILTAYALGELDPTERERVEALVSNSTDAQAAVREIRELAGLLTTELRGEPAPMLSEAQRGAILEAAAAPVPVTPAAPARAAAPAASRRGKWLAALAALAATIAVAAFIIP